MSEAVAARDGQNLEEKIGCVSGEYACIYCGVNGTLYAGSDGVCFLGKFFLFDKRVLLKWTDVKVQQTDQGVAIQTREHDSVLHEFSGIHHPERCWSFLVSLHNQALLDRTGFPATPNAEDIPLSTTSTNRRSQLRRMTSDPNKMAVQIDDLFDKQISKQESGKSPPVQDTKGLRNSAAMMKDRLNKVTLLKLNFMDVDEKIAIEAIAGKLRGQFPCVYSKQRGTLYSGSTALYFVGDRLFFSANVVIQSPHIRQIRMVKGDSEQGIVVWTRDGISHAFLEMENPDQVWASLVALRNHGGCEENKSPRHFTLRRQNSDPNAASRYDLSSPRNNETMEIGAVVENNCDTELPPPSIMTEEELKETWSKLLSDESRYSTVVVRVSASCVSRMVLLSLSLWQELIPLECVSLDGLES